MDDLKLVVQYARSIVPIALRDVLDARIERLTLGLIEFNRLKRSPPPRMELHGGSSFRICQAVLAANDARLALAQHFVAEDPSLDKP